MHHSARHRKKICVKRISRMMRIYEVDNKEHLALRMIQFIIIYTMQTSIKSDLKELKIDFVDI
jgi:hypothetical protein